MSTYEQRKKAQEWVAEKLRESSKGRISSEEAHRESGRIARETDAKNADKKPRPKKGG